MTGKDLAEEVAQELRAALSGVGSARTGGPQTLVQLGFRRKGTLLARVWGQGAGLPEALRSAAREAAVDPLRVTQIEVTLARPGRPLRPEDLSRARANDFRGLMGLELRGQGRVARLGPLEMITRNLGPVAGLKLLLRQISLPQDQAQAIAFPADQFLVDWPTGRVHRLFRGQKLVPQATMTRERVIEMARMMEDWLFAQIGPDGALTYKYWPSTGTYSSANNTLRQFMASAALTRAAQRRGEGGDLVACNFAYNFRHFYTEEAGLGLIHDGPKVKLGAAAVALIACLDHGDAAYRTQIEALTRFILSMQQPDGSLRTFLRPPDRTDCQNFYPGEACLALMRLYEAQPDPDLLHAVGRAFAYYRDWHRAQRNPAFVPWHSAAICLYLRHRPDPQLTAFVFEMTDWLLGLQQGPARPPDVLGEFFDPDRPQFGPPHASSTGVYLEGLIEVWDLAQRLGDPRAETYRKAILAGLRSLRQLQYRHASDMYSIRHRDRVEGALRTATFDNTIRIDNVQHGLMAIHRVLDLWAPEMFGA